MPSEDKLDRMIAKLTDKLYRLADSPKKKAIREKIRELSNMVDQADEKHEEREESSQSTSASIPEGLPTSGYPASKCDGVSEHDIVLPSGEKMHFRASGRTDAPPVLMLHGNPANSVAWEPVMERLPKVHCIAPDLMGYGGSGQPRIPYSFYNHAEYLDEFVAALDLKNVTLFCQDWGCAICLDHAVRHQSNVRGIAFFEGILKPYETWKTFPQKLDPDILRDTNHPKHFQQFKSNLARQKFMEFRGLNYDGQDLSQLDDIQRKPIPPRDVAANEVGGFGWRQVTEMNVFLRIFMGPLLGHPFNPTDPEYSDPFNHPVLGPILKPYVDPHPTAWSRYPIWALSGDIPVQGSPADMTTTVETYSRVMGEWDVHKLLIYSDRGPTLKEEHAQWVRDHWGKNLTVKNLDNDGVKVTEGTHFLQQVHPNEVSDYFRHWFAGVCTATAS